jgi:4-hydroxy-tetrahydrodipicolinate synthase
MNTNPRSKLKGIIAAVLTPLDARGRPDLAAYTSHIRTLEADGCHGILMLGTTGEGPSLGLAERMDLVEAGQEAAGGMAALVCTTCASLPETVALTRHAFDRGVDAVTVMPPFFFKGVDDEGLLLFYRQVLDEAVPNEGKLMLYHIPQVTQVPVSFDLIERLMRWGGQRVAGIKDSAGDLDHCRELCRRFPDLLVFTGNDQLLLSALGSGAAGLVSGLVNVFAPWAAAIYRAYLHEDAQAVRLQEGFTELWAVLDGYQPYPSLLKALAALRYADSGWRWVRPPLVEMGENKRRLMLEALVKLDLPAEYGWIKSWDSSGI